MRRLLVTLAMAFPLVAQVNVTGTQTVNSGQKLNLDTGAVSPSSGDIY